jgi:hypothetical protein
VVSVGVRSSPATYFLITLIDGLEASWILGGLGRLARSQTAFIMNRVKIYMTRKFLPLSQ